MEKARLIRLLNTPGDADPTDFEQLEELITQYPFSQTLHILLAKIGFLLDKPEKNQYLKTAALYASQRGSLKRVIEEEDYPGKVFPIMPYQDLPAFETFSDEDASDIFVLDEETESSSIFREVMRNLEKLKALREQFQFLELNPEESAPGTPEKVETKKAVEPSKSDTLKTSKAAKADAPKKLALQVITPLEEKLDIQVNEFFLAEIQKKKEPIEESMPQPVHPQSDLIDKFIQAQPTIGSVKKEMDRSPDEIVRDLSEKSTRFGDNLISENLAIILLRQGKKDRALEIYKKLIWKLPQKKAYFAARIEEIKK
jgi:tetratricopeptide (TPR) repeat protein